MTLKSGMKSKTHKGFCPSILGIVLALRSPIWFYFTSWHKSRWSFLCFGILLDPSDTDGGAIQIFLKDDSDYKSYKSNGLPWRPREAGQKHIGMTQESNRFEYESHHLTLEFYICLWLFFCKKCCEMAAEKAKHKVRIMFDSFWTDVEGVILLCH